ncbi:hypothetical protein FQR65_LT12580 [Abscondita terminalis]|nr:hypothetical protein FQR65_LT12580 [Abscondita terminalis]
MLEYGFKFDDVADENAKKNMLELKELMANEDVPELSNEQMLHFLVRTDYELQTAKAAINTCYQLKLKAPSIFNDKTIESTRIWFERIELCTMPERTEDGCAVVFVRLIDTNYKNMVVDHYFKVLFMTISLMHITVVKIGILRTALAYLQHGLPVKIKAIHCINTMSFIGTLMKMVRPFIDTSFMQKLHFHSGNMDLEAFHSKHLEKRCLPEDLGGDLPPTRVLHERHVQTMSDLEQYFIDEENQRK